MVFNIEKVEEKFAQVLAKGVLGILIDAGLDEVIACEMVDVMLDRLTNGMHWLPMTEDAVLEKGAIYLLRDKHDGSVGVAEWMEGIHGFAMSIDYLENRENFTHYARITEPK